MQPGSEKSKSDYCWPAYIWMLLVCGCCITGTVQQIRYLWSMRLPITLSCFSHRRVFEVLRKLKQYCEQHLSLYLTSLKTSSVHSSSLCTELRFMAFLLILKTQRMSKNVARTAHAIFQRGQYWIQQDGGTRLNALSWFVDTNDKFYHTFRNMF